MQKLISKFEKYLDTLSQRDQIALAVIVFVVVLAVWFRAAYVPLNNTMTTIGHDLAENNSKLITVQTKMSALQKSISEDPDRANREQLAKYAEDNKKLDLALARTSTQIINPQEMVKLLEQILETQSGLKFISLKNKPAVPEFVEKKNDDAAVLNNVNSIYRHSVVLQVEGNYHSALAYMKKLESLPWRFFWQSVEIETKKYPNSVITLEVYTLGFREGLIGV